jgi:uncharacterized protein (TIGR02186 family)
VTRLALAALLALALTPAKAERLVASLSTHQVMITSNFTGLDLVLFGTVERDNATTSRRSGYDIVATVMGPREDSVTFRKRRLLGIWVNADSRQFVGVPSYVAMLGTKNFDDMAPTDVLRRQQIGLQRVVLRQRIGPDFADTVPDDPFRVAFLRLKTARGLYVEQPNGVTFLTPNLFRATIPLPAQVPTGNYSVELKLFADGAVIARTATAFEIVKTGLEQYVANAARDHGFVYGFITLAMALATGWFASVVFRRD